MTQEEIKELVANEVKKQVNAEKVKLANEIESKFLYTGEFAKAYYLIQVFREWVRF